MAGYAACADYASWRGVYAGQLNGFVSLLAGCISLLAITLCCLAMRSLLAGYHAHAGYHCC
jgi:hypothetical protein